MTNYAALVQALYALPDASWDDVALWCNGDNLSHGRGYYLQIASGRIKTPSAETCAGIAGAPTYRQHLLTCDVSNDTRKTVHPHDDDHAAGNLERLRLGIGWPAMFHRMWVAYENRQAWPAVRCTDTERDETFAVGAPGPCHECGKVHTPGGMCEP